MGRLPTLDGLRGLAAVAVMLFHGGLVAKWPMVVATNGYLAVDLFFALSGFVIAGAYGDRLRAGLGAARFLLLRITRLGPMHVLGQALGFVLMTAGGLIAIGPALGALAPGLLLIPIPVRDLFPLNGPAWSLFWELAVNLLFVLALPFLTLRRLVAAAGATALVLTVTAIHYGTLHVGWELPHIIGGLPRVLFSFCIGLILHQLRPAPIIRTGGAIAMAAIVVILCFRGVTSWSYDLPVVLIVFPLTLYLAATWQTDGITATVFRALGDLSYPLYALHLPVIYIVNQALRTVPHTAPHSGTLDLLVWTTTFIALIAAAWWISRHVDQPAQAWLRQRLARRQPA